jgi:hypothetical protein
MHHGSNGLERVFFGFHVTLPAFFGRGWIWSGESSGPPLFAPFLKVEGDTGHLKLRACPPHQRSGSLKRSGVHKVLRFVLAPSGSHHTAEGDN